MKTENSIVFIGLGTNIGNRLENLEQAKAFIENIEHTSLLKTSSVYESPPLGIIKQSPYYNVVIQLSTALPALSLLSNLKNIEVKMGRPKVYKKWGPRIIDCDILFYDHVHLKHHILEIPHPEIQNRKFVLEPLLELENILHPVLGLNVQEMLEQTPDTSTLVKVSRL